MSTVGVGRALREQKKAATRRQRVERSAASNDLQLDHEIQSCASCSASVPTCDMFGTERGGVCSSCYVEHIDVPTQGLSSTVQGLASVAIAWGVPLLMLTTVLGANQDAFTGKSGMGWVVLASLGVIFAAFAGMHSARYLRDSMNQISIDHDVPDSTDHVGVVVGAVGAASGVLGILAVFVLGAMPYL